MRLTVRNETHCCCLTCVRATDIATYSWTRKSSGWLGLYKGQYHECCVLGSVISRKLRFRQTSNSFLLLFVDFVFNDPGMPSRFPVAHKIFGGHNFCNVPFFLWYEKIMATQISCNKKSAWHIISVETESLYLLQFSTLSKYLKIYRPYAQ
jgi:hypothetical protein